MPEGKKKRSLHEAFGVVRQPGESVSDETPEDGGPGREAEAEKKPAARKTSRTSSNGGARGAVRARLKKEANSTSEPVNTAADTRTRSGGRGRGASRAASGTGSDTGDGEMVPGKGGVRVPAQTPVNMTFTVTARERYLWTLELKRRGLTAVGVLRETMEAMIREEGGEG